EIYTLSLHDALPISVTIIDLRHEPRKAAIGPVHQRRRGPKIAAQTLHFEAQLADALLREFEECPNLRLAKTVDGLHRVAHAKHAAAVALLPSAGQKLHQCQLRAGCILKFVDE